MFYENDSFDLNWGTEIAVCKYSNVCKMKSCLVCSHNVLIYLLATR